MKHDSVLRIELLLSLIMAGFASRQLIMTEYRQFFWGKMVGDDGWLGSIVCMTPPPPSWSRRPPCPGITLNLGIVRTKCMGCSRLSDYTLGSAQACPQDQDLIGLHVFALGVLQFWVCGVRRQAPLWQGLCSHIIPLPSGDTVVGQRICVGKRGLFIKGGRGACEVCAGLQIPPLLA